MPNIPDRQALGLEELSEYSTQGPFGGIQTEVPASMVSELGFAAASNICFRLGRAIARPGIVSAGTAGTYVAGTQMQGFAQFYSGGFTYQVAFKGQPTGGDGGLYIRNNDGTWSHIASSGGLNPDFLVAFAGIEGFLAYSGGGPIRLFDGTAITSPASAPVATTMAEVALHLLTGFNTTYTWSGVGDPTDWTSFSAGNNVYDTDIGPIVSIQKLGQMGYGFHLSGIIQIIPTGIGTAPFAFEPLVSANKGCLSPGLIAKFEFGGVDCAAYASQGNIQLFNQTQSLSIGDAPIGGNRRKGARQAICADLYSARLFLAALGSGASGFGMVATDNIKGVPFKALWMLIRNILWCYNLDEDNWTRFVLAPPPVITDSRTLYGGFGLFDFDTSDILSNTSLTWPSLALSKGNTIYQMNFDTPSEQAMSLTSGKITFGDVRHLHTVKKFRLRITDFGTVTYTLTITNEKGVSQTQVVTLGTNSGDDLAYIFSFSLPGLRFTYNISAPANAQFAVIELAPIYDIGGEQRGGFVDN
jgi:hypothetical protein